MTILVDVSSLRDTVSGAVLTSEDDGYDEARKLWNAEFDRRPDLIARCLDTADVAAAVRFARAEDLEISVRGGAHNGAGTGIGDGGITIDVSAINKVTVDPEKRRALVGGGALLQDLDAATQEHGLAVPAGEISHTGVGGLTLGGGMGWLTRQHGLSLDNVRSAEIVLADGQVVRTSADEHPDLFWAIRGGGGNFGVVTEFEFQLHPVGPIIHFGMFFFAMDRATETLRFARETIAALPPEVSFQVVAMNAPPAPFVPTEHHFVPGIVLMLIGFGSADQHAEAAATLRDGLTPTFEMVSPMPYTALQSLFDDATAWGQYSYEKASYVPELTDELIDVLVRELPKKTSVQSLLQLYVLSGAYCDVEDEATAFSGGRSARLGVFVIALAGDADSLAPEKIWAQELHDAVQPFALSRGMYVNSLAVDEADRVRESYGEKYPRLAAIKKVYDPQNVFHRNSNILPAG
jgi:FAD/FMN-containing dehydrogenase